MKKLISIVISIVIMITSVLCVSFNVLAADVLASGTCGANNSNLRWSIDSDYTITISGEGLRMADFSNSVPWSSYTQQIKRVVVEDGVINIGANAFKNCTALVEVDFGNIDTIGDNAFNNCTSLKQAILPDNCTWIWQSAFVNCTSLQSAYINAVDSYANTVPADMFNGCTSLAVLELGSSITTLGSNALKNCNSLTAIITNGSFSSSDYSGIIYNDSVKTGVCSDNTYSSSNLTYSWDTKASTLSFSGSGDMLTYENSTQPWYKFMGACKKVDFSQTDGKVTISTTAFQGSEAIEELDLTNVYAVGWGAFAECSSIKDIQFDSTIEEIWNYAFANNTSVNRIMFKDGVNDLHIHAYSFNNCSGSTYWLDLPKNTRYVDDHAFINTNFNFIKVFSENVTIGDDAFGNGSGGYARFFGVGSKDTGVYSFVKKYRENNSYSWYYYCLDDNHTYCATKVEPSCSEMGYDFYTCAFCDADGFKNNFTDPLGHSYKFVSSNNGTNIYDCRRCDAANMEFSSLDVINYFSRSISTVAGDLKYNQQNYDGRLDVNIDGVVNAKDFKLITDSLNTINVDNKKTTVNLNKKYQTIDGFGASAAWWSQTVGGWENADEILGLLYDEEDGIGLNIYRYNLGAGSRDTNDTSLYEERGRTNCFLQSDGTYNWDNDPSAMNALSLAQAHNPNLKVTLFSNSPPVYMTTNGRAYLSPNTKSNISSSNYQKFADFTVKCAEHFIDEGYNVTEVSPINEPEWGWSAWTNSDGSISMNQEGCHWEYKPALEFYNKYMVPTLKNSSKCNGKVGLSVWECGQIDHSSYWDNYLNYLFSSRLIYKNNNSNIRSYVDAVDVHSYWVDSTARKNAINDINGSYFGQKVRCTEYCQMTNDYNSGVIAHINAEGGSTNGMSIDYGLAMADIIYQDMTIMNAIEWDWWVAVARGIYPDGLIYVDDADHSYETSKRLWCLGNYSKFIDEGAVRVDVSTGSEFGSKLYTKPENIYEWDDENGNHVVDKNNYIEQSAYLNPDGSVVIVYINNSDTNEYTSFDSNAFSSFTSYVTDSNRNLEMLQSVSADNVACIPARSVTTFVLK